MDDPLLVRGLEGRRDLARDAERLVDGKRPARDALGQRLAFDELQDERLGAARLLEAVDVRNVRMVERGEDLGLALEARQPLRIRGEEPPAGP